MAKKLYDVAAKVGSYVDQSGNEKNRYQNLGVFWMGSTDRTFFSTVGSTSLGFLAIRTRIPSSSRCSLHGTSRVAGPPPQSNTDDEVVF
jgi:hypothetical protein